ncbi:MAG: endonuclease/exonuclease/phosphatase family protein [bacterium]|jgi:endonuclease/exonuclease/phosphatase family metal-dependent hydrolase|nr:endonuclease/exonuclease/phosphatase family protein [candidate division KSB1 bacterium]MDH7559419.1 endonuclease/exonuclease/phosphatase family protein [bacterium]
MLLRSLQDRGLKVHRALAIAVMLACSGCGLLGLGRRLAGLELNLMTFNIRYGTAEDGPNSWSHRRELVFQVLEKNDADVVGLQEALHFQLQEICQALPRYGYVGVGRDDGAEAGEYAALLYRKDRFAVEESGAFWFSDTPEVPGSTSWGNELPRICTWARLRHPGKGVAFYVFNLHLDHVSQRSRERSVQLLAERIGTRSSTAPVFVMGDLNAGPRNPVVAFLKGSAKLALGDGKVANNPLPLVDTYSAIHADTSAIGTFHGFTGDRSGAKIDYIFAAPSVKVRGAHIDYTNAGGRYPSDHFPVTARVVVPAAGMR